MPIRRATSCVNCRRAKARCWLSTPCLRCATRSLACQYAAPLPRLEDRWPRGFRPIRPATDTAVNGTTVGNDIDGASDTNLTAQAARSATLAEDGTQSSSMNMYEEAEVLTWPEIGTGTPPADVTNFSDFNQLFDVSEPLTVTPVSHNLQTGHFPHSQTSSLRAY